MAKILHLYWENLVDFVRIARYTDSEKVGVEVCSFSE